VGADGTIPEGQGIIMAHLNECHELVEMVSFIKTSNDMCSSHANQLKEAMDEGDEEDEEEDEEILTGQ
jgi:cell division protein ZapA (FtsZ GTPase activity inhibitor)